MKKVLTLILLAVTFILPSFAQAGLNDKADNIVGEYLTDRGGKKSKVRVPKEKKWHLYGSGILGRTAP